MPGPGLYGNKRERRKQIAKKVAKTRARLEPNKPWSGDKRQFRDTYSDIMRRNPDSPDRGFRERLKDAKAYNRYLRKKYEKKWEYIP